MPQIQGQYTPSGSTWYNSAAAEETKLVKSGAGLLFYIAITNSNASTRYAYLFDSTTASGALIHPPIPLATNTQVIVALPYSIAFGTGLFVAASSTNATFTAAAGNDFRMTALYK